MICVSFARTSLHYQADKTGKRLKSPPPCSGREGSCGGERSEWVVDITIAAVDRQTGEGSQDGLMRWDLWELELGRT